jgi:hypothetical protein
MNNNLPSIFGVYPLLLGFLSIILSMAGLEMIPVALTFYAAYFLYILILTNNGNISFVFSGRAKAVLLLSSWLIFTYLLSDSVYKEMKLVGYAYHLFVPVLLFSFFQKRFYDGSCVTTYLVISIFILSVVALIFTYNIDSSGRISMPGIENPIWVSRYFGCFGVVFLWYSSNDINRNKLYIYNLLYLGSLLVMLVVGSKGPLVAFIVVWIAVHGIFSLKKLFVIVSVIFIGYYISFDNSYLFTSNISSFLGRYEIIVTTINMYTSEFNLYNLVFGYGMASFPEFFYSNYNYPHNIFIEILFESGLIGFILFTVILFNFFKRFKVELYNLLALFFLISSLFSGDIPTNSAFFIFYILSAGLMNKEGNKGRLKKEANLIK